MVKFLLIVLSIPILIATLLMGIVAILLVYVVKKTGLLKYLPYFKHRQFSPSVYQQTESSGSQTVESTELLVPCPQCGVYVSRVDLQSHQASHR
jgi:hypothetical protein